MNVALLLSPLFVATALLPTEAAEFVYLNVHLNRLSFVIIGLHLFLFALFQVFDAKDTFLFSVYSSKVI